MKPFNNKNTKIDKINIQQYLYQKSNFRFPVISDERASLRRSSSPNDIRKTDIRHNQIKQSSDTQLTRTSHRENQYKHADPRTAKTRSLAHNIDAAGRVPATNNIQKSGKLSGKTRFQPMEIPPPMHLINKKHLDKVIIIDLEQNITAQNASNKTSDATRTLPINDNSNSDTPIYSNLEKINDTEPSIIANNNSRELIADAAFASNQSTIKNIDIQKEKSVLTSTNVLADKRDDLSSFEEYVHTVRDNSSTLSELLEKGNITDTFIPTTQSTQNINLNKPLSPVNLEEHTRDSKTITDVSMPIDFNNSASFSDLTSASSKAYGDKLDNISAEEPETSHDFVPPVYDTNARDNKVVIDVNVNICDHNKEIKTTKNVFITPKEQYTNISPSYFCTVCPKCQEEYLKKNKFKNKKKTKSLFEELNDNFVKNQSNNKQFSSPNNTDDHSNTVRSTSTISTHPNSNYNNIVDSHVSNIKPNELNKGLSNGDFKKTKDSLNNNRSSNNNDINDVLNNDVISGVFATNIDNPNDEHKDEHKLEIDSLKEIAVSNNITIDNVNDSLEKVLHEHQDFTYKLPTIELLNKKQETSIDTTDWVNEKAETLNTTLNQFNVKAKVISYTQGPSITRYEIQPKPGVKVSKITNLVDELKLNLATKDIRIEAPIPGKQMIGIEIPNQYKRPVFLREIIASENFNNNSAQLPIAVGLDVSGQAIVTDLAKMPHGLVAGATGAGKSVFINTLLVSLLYKTSPEQLRLLLIDPKMVELHSYNDIPHLVAPVINDPSIASASLKWAVVEMERRYELFVNSGARNITSYNNIIKNSHTGEKILPYIVIIIDELADLMMTAPSEVEESICRLAQKARAAGINLIVATQRPSVDVITGLIKANIPTRISFSVSSQTDSRTILDQGGAEKLLGQGDLLFLENGSSKTIRIQGAFISDEEIAKVIDFIKQQQYHADFLFLPKDLENQTKTNTTEAQDPLLTAACIFAVETGSISASSLQRKFRIGYNRAARIVDLMEQYGVVSAQNGSKPRNVLITEHNLENIDSILI